MSPAIKKIVLDVLKPHQPPIYEFAMRIEELPNVNKVSISTQERDEQTETVKVVIEGVQIDYDEVEKRIVELGGSVHSVDEVTVEKGTQE
ncbi:MAG: DUF211 domain-containing protein [Candidatus Bathyarchaeota archaeon]|nr:DUF211 domain-containing protein [Candidatus Bathyarchaeota archaeon]